VSETIRQTQVRPPRPVEGNGRRSDRSDLLLRIEGLKTHFFTDEGEVRAVDGVDIEVPRGKTVCLVGESGCGKSITARSILRLIERPGEIVDGSIHWWADGKDPVEITKLDGKSAELKRLRGGDIGMIFQEPMASLSPMYTVGAQLSEAIRIHLGLDKTAARRLGIEMLRKVGIPQPEQRFDSYPFQLSGGMCQRVMIAIALSCSPALLIADEPTTALDVTTQARILDLLRELQAESDMSMLFITHDLGVVAEIADEVTVMYLGKVAEHGTVEQIFNEPKHPYTRALLRSIPTMRAGRRREHLNAIRGMVPHPLNRPDGCPFHDRCEHVMPGICDATFPVRADFGASHLAFCHLYSEAGEPIHPGAAGDGPSEESEVLRPAQGAGDGAAVRHAQGAEVKITEPAGDGAAHRQVQDAEDGTLIELRDLAMHFPIKKGAFGRTIGHVRAVDGVSLKIKPGETLGLVGESGCGKTTLGRCIARILTPTSGSINYQSRNGSTVDVATLSGRELSQYRRDVRVIFQDPFSSLNPRMTVEQLLAEPLRNNKIASGSELRDRIAESLRVVGLRPEYMQRYPHAFSGGQRQRLNIARALVTQPRLVVADEAVSALDVSVRAQILNLLSDLQEQFDLTYLFISHDLSVVEHISDRVTVMYLGKVVEQTDTHRLYTTPEHPYTEALLHAVPVPDLSRRGLEKEFAIPDDLPDPSNPPPGCPFHTRCQHVREEGCRDRVPALRQIGERDHLAACHYSEELELSGMV
jgi:peptide/nickel transport system ATP-binding protein